LTDKTLLPPNRTRLEAALASAGERLDALQAPLEQLWDPWRCELEWLPWLAWSLGVEEWDESWPEAVKRQSVASMLEIRWHGGTVWAVREALRAAGYADAQLIEGLPQLKHDGSQLHDGVEDYSAGARWALFKLVADIGEERGVGGEELSRLLRLVERAQPKRSELREVEYRTTVSDQLAMEDPHAITARPALEEVRPAGRRYDGAIRHDQAEQLPRAPQHYDGAYRHTGELRFDGLKPYHDWAVHGERYANRWDELAVAAYLDTEERHQLVAFYDGAAAHEGALSHGAEQPPMVDAGTLRLTLRRRHNGRLSYDGAHRHRGGAPNHYPL